MLLRKKGVYRTIYDRLRSHPGLHCWNG